MDLTNSAAPRSDQQNYDDYLAGPRTVTITGVRAGSAEQPVEVHLAEFPGRPFKPSKSMIRVLMHAWGSDAAVYAGRRMTLYGDPTVKFGGLAVGGIRISHLSDIDEAKTIALTTTRGKRAPFTVEPLTDEPTAEQVAASTSLAELKAWWGQSSPERRAQIEARAGELQ